MSRTCVTQEGSDIYIALQTALVGLRCRWVGMGILIGPLSYLSALLHLCKLLCVEC